MAEIDFVCFALQKKCNLRWVFRASKTAKTKTAVE
jgi:hypothetical protein